MSTTNAGKIFDAGSEAKFKNKDLRYCLVSNDLTRDSNLSLRAKGLYLLIQSYITIPNFQLYKKFLLSLCIEGRESFEKSWKELSDAGYLASTRVRDSRGSFCYNYDLLESVSNRKQISLIDTEFSSKEKQTGKIVDKGSEIKFKNKEVKFCMVPNELVRNKEISLSAKGLYLLIRSYITIPNIILSKSKLEYMCIEGEKAFKTVWKELQNSGYLVCAKRKNDKGVFCYEYDLLDCCESKQCAQNNDNNPDPHFPYTVNAEVDNPDTEDPEVDEPDMLNPACGKPVSIFKLKELDLNNNTELLNTEIIKEDMIEDEDRDKKSVAKKSLAKNRPSINEAILNNEVNTYYSINEILNFINKKMDLSNIETDSLTMCYVNIIQELLLEIYTNTDQEISLGKKKMLTVIAKRRLLNLESRQIEIILKYVIQHKDEITNLSNFLKVSLVEAYAYQHPLYNTPDYLDDGDYCSTDCLDDDGDYY